MATIRVGLAQRNVTVGALEANSAILLDSLQQGFAQGCDVVAFPELALVGYPPEDLLLKDGFLDDAAASLQALSAASPRCVGVIGTVVGAGSGLLTTTGPRDARDVAQAGTHVPPRRLANAAALLGGGQLLDVVAKRQLPNYGVFDEQRWFSPGSGPTTVFSIGGATVGVVICEDVWVDNGPAEELARSGASLLLVLNASPYSKQRRDERLEVVSRRARSTGCSIAYVNLVGGQDELVFDGGSFVVDPTGELVARAPQFEEDLLVVDLELPDAPSDLPVLLETRAGFDRGPRRPGVVAEPVDEVEEVYEALVLGTRDYLAKNGFTSAVIGLSGGIDSTLVAAIAVDAIGADSVLGASMPSRYSSEHSRTDAAMLCARLGVRCVTVGIEGAHVALAEALSGVLDGEPKGLTDENLQSRIRGVLLMAISNATGAIVLTTGNKSELATGYSTLYGDSAGGFAVIKDVVKLLVYDLCGYRNARAVAQGQEPPIPESVLTKPPSAELRADQRDDDSLPPYELLDPILESYVEQDRTVAQLIAEGHDPALVQRIASLVDAAEYKRRQLPPGVRITSKSFGKDRRLPITNRYGQKKPT